jgi:transcriptional regulator with XRE-family HTH domain
MLPSSSSLQGYLVAVTDKGFYLALGQRVAAARKARDLTQQQLADELGIAQQTLAHYEAGRLRVAVALLPPLARALGVSTEHLIGENESRSAVSKRGPASRLQQQIARIQQLPRARQRFLFELIETTLQQAGNPQAGSAQGS